VDTKHTAGNILTLISFPMRNEYGRNIEGGIRIMRV